MGGGQRAVGPAWAGKLLSGAVATGAQPESRGYPSTAIPMVETLWVGPRDGEVALSNQHFPSPACGNAQCGKAVGPRVTPGTGTQLGCEQLPCVSRGRTSAARGDAEEK